MGTRVVTYKCPFCDKRYNREDLVNHIEEVHPYEIPKDFTALRYVFNYVNKKPLTYHGKCTECGGPTPWDEKVGRYKRQCGSKACHDSYVAKFEKNMVNKTGNTRISKTEEGQRKMLANRKISGTYTFQNGKKKTYTGSYEKKTLEFMDKVMNIDPDDLMCPGPVLEYSLDGKKHIYITDFYYIPYDLVIEVKDGGNNPNKRNMPEYRAKQIAKEEYIIKNTDYNYLRLTDNNLKQLLAVFMDLKMQLVDKTGKRVIHVNESSSNKYIEEMMGACMSMAPVAGIKDSDTYITTDASENNVFSSVFGSINGKKKYGINKNTNKIEEITEDIKLGRKYKLDQDVHELGKILKEFMDNDWEVTTEEMYQILTGETLYQWRQISYRLPVIEDARDDAFIVWEADKYVKNIINEDSELDAIEESVKEIINGQV